MSLYGADQDGARYVSPWHSPARRLVSSSVSVLGEGGQKVVYLVRDSALERDCTLSLIKTDVLEPADLALLAQEAQAMGRLHHPNIVVVHNIGEDEGRPYIVCEYVAGGDLRLL